MISGLYQRVVSAFLGALIVVAPASGQAPIAPIQPQSTSAESTWQGWRLPLPAGAWRITRGPCDGASAFDHECGYYENTCALDFAPITGSMEDVPVLAPAEGVVFFVGTRENTGRMLMVRHADGRVSGYMHLSRVVVQRESPVTRGQVLGYAGHTGTAQAHLHFWVQPDVVQRACVDLTGLEQQDLLAGRAVSTNRDWTALDLVDPPAALPDWLPQQGANAWGPAWRLPGKLRLAPGASLVLPVSIRGPIADADTLEVGATVFRPIRRADGRALFSVPITAPQTAGRLDLTLTLQSAALGPAARVARLTILVEQTPVVSGVDATILINPTFVSPANYAVRTGQAELCWAAAPEAGLAPLQYRAFIVRDPEAAPAAGGALIQADSGWQPGTCWTTPKLAPGAYLWKVFISDALGLVNRPNQRPAAVIIR